MKAYKVLIISLMLLLVMALVIVGCTRTPENSDTENSNVENSDTENSDIENSYTENSDTEDSDTDVNSEETTTDSQTETTENSCDHVYDEGVVTLEPTCYEQGVLLQTCTLCGFENEVAIEVAEAVYTINLGELGEFLVPESGVYKLEDPIKVGYEFINWLDPDGNEFPKEGTITASINLTPVFKLLDTKTVEELYERAAGGADVIKIVNDIVIDRTIYVTGATKIYSEKSVKLIRAKDYAGDMFVVGQDPDGEKSILLGYDPTLILGEESYTDDKILLTIDGNRDGMNTGVEVVGTGIFAIYGARVEMYNGVSISNHQKTGNERIFTVNKYQFGHSNNIGGAAVMISTGSSLYMYGGVMDNNSARIEPVIDETGASKQISSYGGAIYNNGMLYMAGGVISNCSANRGGAVYAYSVTEIVGGVLEGNYAKNKGGAVCSSGSDSVDIIIGTEGAEANSVVFRNNSAGTQGGAILSYQDSPIIILGGALFEGNTALGTNGGAIATSGTVTCYSSSFVGNTAKYSGGAIYQSYSSAEKMVRIVEIHNTEFKSNSANSGGAVTLTSGGEGEKGAVGRFFNCRFTENVALHYVKTSTDSETGETVTKITGGKGGAIYSSQYSSFDIDGCEFTGNKSEHFGGGAIAATVSSKINVKNSTFSKNTAIDVDGNENGRSGVGGAIYAYNGASLTVSGTKFSENNANKNGGAIYVSANKAKLTDVELANNTAGLNGGAIAQVSDNVLDIKGIKAYGNTAGSGGGVLYNSTSTLNIISGEDVKNIFGISGNTDNETQTLANTANNGGAICGGNTSILNIDGAVFENNVALPDEGYGGAIYATYGTQLDITDSKFKSNSGKYGGALSLAKSATVVNVSNTEFEGNSSTNCGGVVYSLSATTTLKSITAWNNVSNKGGVLYLSSMSNTTVSDSELTGNAGTYGGVVYASGSETAEFKNVNFVSNGVFGEAVTKHGGVIYVIGTSANIEGGRLDNNSATGAGGVVYLAGTETKVDSEGVETKTKAAAITLSKVDLNGNVSKNGGAIYASTDSSVALESLSFVSNSANATESDNDARGGAIYMYGATLRANKVEFRNNHADYYGGAIDAHTNSSAELNNVKFIDNSSINNGGAIWMYTNTRFDITGIYASGNTTASSGGFAYTRGVLNVYPDKDFGNVFEGVAEGKDAIKNAKGGGAIYCGTSSQVSVDSADFTRFNASNGGAMYVVGVLDAWNSNFVNNTASSGGAIYISNTASSSGCTFTGNAAEYYGGAICVEENSSYFDGADATDGETIIERSASSFANNSSKYGGAIYLYSVEDPEKTPEYKAAEATLEGSRFTGNTAAADSGAIRVSSGATLITKNAYFEANSAPEGGAIGLNSGSAYTDNGSTFKGNIATVEEGGAIHSTGNIAITNTKFIGNKAESEGRRGGAIYLSTGSLTAEGAWLEGNSASGNAGAIVLTAAGETLLDGCTFKDNLSGGRAGAIYLHGSVLTTVDCEFNGNIAANGGAIYATTTGTYTDGSADSAEKGSSFIGNRSSESGGALYSTGSITLYGTRFEDNEATADAGAVYTSNKAILNNVTVSKNVSGGVGAIYVGGGSISVGGAMTVNENTNGNTYLASGRIITVAEALTEDSRIGVTTASVGLAFAKPDGVSITDISEYIDNFFCDSGDPVYKNEKGELVGEFIILEQPASLNQYTVTATGTPSYAWHTWVDGALGEAIDGQNTATLTSGIDGQSYVCVITCGQMSLITDPVVYMQIKHHPICGEVCDCVGETHENLAWLPITTLTELELAVNTDGSYYLAFDFVLEQTVTVNGNVNICLNGKKLSRGGEEAFTMIKVATGATLTLIDCDTTERVGFIDPITGLWTEGGYSGEGAATEYKLYGGIITNGNGAGGVAISVSGTLNTKGINFAGNTASSGSAIYCAGILNDIGSVFVGNATTGQAGAVFVEDATLEDSVFAYNRSFEDRGGAILVTGGSIYAKNVTFEYNDGYRAGGAVVITGAEASVFEGCTFHGNTDHTYRGGALYAHNSILVTTLSCIFTDNSGKAGGAVYVTSSAPYTDGSADGRNGSTFIGNTSQSAGGAAYILGECHLYGTVFENNVAATSGGAVYTSNTSIFNATFSGNTAQNGGALYVSGGVVNAYAAIFNENSVSLGVTETTDPESGETTSVKTYLGNGGAVFVASGAIYNDEGSEYEGNIAALGGAVYVGGAYNAQNGSFVENAAITSETQVTSTEASETTVEYGKGGAVYVAENGSFSYTAAERLTFTDGAADTSYAGPRFEGNIAANGAAVYLSEAVTADAAAGKASIIGATFMNHSTMGSGSAIYYGAGSSDNVISNSVFYKNTTDSNGAMLYMASGVTVNADGLTAVENTGNRGGAIYISGGTLTVSNSEFLNNKAIVTEGGTTARGAAIFVNSGTLNATAVRFIGNVANSNGGAMVTNSKNAKAYLHNVEFINNVTEIGNGGAIWLYGNSVVEITGIVAKGNKATGGYGGFAYLSSGNLDILSGEGVVNVFGGEGDGEGNAAKHGGVIGNSGTINISGASFIGNSATTYGGAIYTAGAANITDSIFNSNSASYGGAVYVSDNETATRGCTFTENTAKNGGAIYVAKGAYTDGEAILDGDAVTGAVNGSTFSSNSSSGTELGGGAIYTVVGATLYGTKLESNTSALNGGAVYTTGSLGAYYCELNGNSSSGSGGAMYAIGDIELVVEGGIMKDNKTASSKNGGAICAYEDADSKIGPTCTIRGTVFDGNSSYSGGALSLRNQGDAKTEHVLENITLINNKGGNGAIYIYNNTKVTVSGLVATDNVSTSKGSVFYVTSSKTPTLVIKDAEISGNADGSGAINFVYIANKTAVVDIYTDKISGNDFTAAGITDITDITSAGWENLIKNASNGTINAYTTPADGGSGEGSQQ